jgi:adenosylcobinamide-GDP ribazoletransferase
VRGAFAFLTILGRGTPPDRRSVVWFGPVGVVVGAACGLVRWGAGAWWPPFVAAALTVAADLALTGLLHLDGLADAADGLLPHLHPEQRLAVMARADVGAFAVGVVGAMLLLRWSALAALPVHGWHWVALLAGIWCGARTAMAAIVSTVRYARPDGGLATTFIDARPWLPVMLGLALAIVGAALGRGVGGVVGLATGSVAAAGVTALALRRIAGFTGDVLGAAGVVFETVALVVATAHW